MKYFVGKNRKPVNLEKEDVLDSGGEAVIFGVNGKAIKVYHKPDRLRSDKLNFFFSKNPTIHPTIIAPEAPIFGNQQTSQIIGFEMALLPPSVEPLAMLMREDFCVQHGITGKIKMQIFANMLEGLHKAHCAGLVVGDINDQNERFDLRQLLTYWIDVDSWQFGGFPCMVGTEDYLAPDLYNIDLSKEPQFKPEHDYYSFTVLLFRALMMVHPFGGGFHKQHKSLFDRARRGLTILDSSVRYPKKANPAEILTDDMANLMLGYLKRQRQDPFPMEKLQEYADVLVECSSCHLWYPATRSNCPGCAEKTILATQIATKVAGCICEIILETPGKILHFQFIGNTICCITEEGGIAVLYQKPQNGPLTRKELFNATLGARYSLFRETLVVCIDPASDEPALYLLNISNEHPQPIAQSSTCKFAGKGAVFGCSSRRLYRIAGTRVISGDLFGSHLADREVIQVIPNQTWFTVASNPDLNKEILFGYYRIFDELKWFLVTGDSEGKNYTRFDVGLEPLTVHESLIDLSIQFGAKIVLILRHTRVRGTNYVRIEQANITDGQITKSQRIKISEARTYETIHGKGYTDDMVLHPTDNGIVMENLADQSATPLSGTDNYVTSDSQLHRYKKGVLSVTRDRIIFLTTESK